MQYKNRPLTPYVFTRVQKFFLTLLGFLATLFVTTPAAAIAPAPHPSIARFETRFMEDMIDHHAMAVEMAQLCVDKATHEELRALCQQIITAQQDEVANMQSWLLTWYNVSHEPKMTRREERQLERLAALSGAEFETEFMVMMIKHHWTAVGTAMRCVGRAFHEELETLCEDIITTQIAEILQLRSWLCQWYALCHYGLDGKWRHPHPRMHASNS